MIGQPAATHDATVPYFEFVREERQFCAVLAHLLLQRGSNLRQFLKLLAEQLELDGLPHYADPEAAPVESAQIYIEFAYLRDIWDGFRSKHRNNQHAANADRRAFLLQLMRVVPGLARIAAKEWPEHAIDVNARFMGTVDREIAGDIASPHHWKLPALFPALLALATDVAAGDEAVLKETFRALCKFKWSFSIKPDLVILLPGLRPLCVEAKLLSREGQYPSGRDSALFDQLFRRPEHRVRQVELQDFLFRQILGWGVQQVYIARTSRPITVPGEHGQLVKVPVLSWKRVYERLDRSGSPASVDAFLRQNVYLSEDALIQSGEDSEQTGLGAFSELAIHHGVVNGLDAILDVISKRRRGGLVTDVGYTGGRKKLEQRTFDTLGARQWKWRDPTADHGRVIPRNWISSDAFEAIVERLRQRPTAN